MLTQSVQSGTGAAAGAATSGNGLFARLLSMREAAELAPEWRDLQSRALESNVFCGADFLLATARHLHEGPAPHFIAIRDSRPGNRLLGLFPVQARGLDLTGGVLRSWRNAFAAYGAPLIDRDQAVPVLKAFFDFAADWSRGTRSFIFEEVASDGPVAAAVLAAASALGLPVARLSRRERAVLVHGPAQPGFAPGRKHAKELRRVRRRLSERGTVTFRIARTAGDVAVELERFLALEASGWKGRRGTALVQTPDRANFTRMLVRGLSRNGGVRIAMLECDGAMVAGVIMFRSADRLSLWKIAYDEAYAACAPGQLLIEDVSRTYGMSGRPGLIDSCAQPGNQMIESLWGGRMALTDIAIGLQAGQPGRFETMLMRERLRRDLRERVKTVYRRLRGWSAAPA